MMMHVARAASVVWSRRSSCFCAFPQKCINHLLATEDAAHINVRQQPARQRPINIYQVFAHFMSTPTDRTASRAFFHMRKHAHAHALAPTTSIRISCFDASPQAAGQYTRHGQAAGFCGRAPTTLPPSNSAAACTTAELQQQLQ